MKYSLPSVNTDRYKEVLKSLHFSRKFTYREEIRVLNFLFSE